MAPRRQQRQIEVRDGSEAGGQHDEVPHVAAEGEAGPGVAFELQPFPADQRGGVAGPLVGDGGDKVGQDLVRQVIYAGGGVKLCSSSRSSSLRSRHGKRLMNERGLIRMTDIVSLSTPDQMCIYIHRRIVFVNCKNFNAVL